MSTILLAAAQVSSPSTSLGQVAKLYPVDEGTTDPSFFIYRLRLIEAVARRDTSALFGALSPAIKVSFGGGAGLDDFRREWEPDSADSKLWSTLSEVMAGGGSMATSPSDAWFEAPYWTSEWRNVDHDAFDYGVIIGEQVLVRARPTTQSEAIAALSFDIVRAIDPYASSEEEGREFVQVELEGGARGYVSREFYRSPVGYRAGFRKVDGTWQMQWFLAGD
ncbi:MAG: SH3 domain-containing protein [Rhodothermia bacterium]|nr:SH3 domain-containing protein [Rhodothermia bacterium]